MELNRADPRYTILSNNNIRISITLTKKEEFRHLIISKLHINLRYWWKAWSNGINVLEPRKWYEDGNYFIIECAGETSNQIERIEQFHQSSEYQIRKIVYQLHSFGIFHGNISSSCWMINDTMYLTPNTDIETMFLSRNQRKLQDLALIKTEGALLEPREPCEIETYIKSTYEIEEIADYCNIYRYRLIDDSKGDKKQIYLHYEIPHPILGELHRAKARFLYSFLLKKSSGESIDFICGPEPSPYSTEGKLIEIIGASETDENVLIYESKKGKELPQEGWCHPYDIGSTELAKRKRQSIEAGSRKRHIQRWFSPDEEENELHLKREELVNHFLDNEEILCVQGPPGTGKTYIATELVYEMLKRNPYARILVCAKEHQAVNLLRKKINRKFKYDMPPNIRHMPSRYSEQIHGADIFPSIEEEIQKLFVIKTETEPPSWARLRINNLDQPPEILSHYYGKTAQIVFSTTTSKEIQKANEDYVSEPFDLVVVEEASKCYPSELLPALELSRKAFLIGDQNQLPPFQIEILEKTIESLKEQSKDSEERKRLTQHHSLLFRQMISQQEWGWGLSLQLLKPFQYLQAIRKTRFMLNQQYRMIPKLSDMTSRIFYNTTFEKKRPEHNCIPLFSHPVIGNRDLVWIDIPHSSKYPAARENRRYKVNRMEMAIVNEIMRELRYHGRKPPEIAILTPYNAQVDRLAGRYGMTAYLPKRIQGVPNIDVTKRVHTVDSYQGQEADLIIISLVRNNPLGSPRNAWGFLTSPERLNVMFSRARRQLFIIGSTEHVRLHQDHEDMKHLSSILDYVEEYGTVIDYKELGVRL